jgi:hypothetical protein
MHAIPPDQSKRAWQERLMRSGYLVGAILAHLIIFFMVATLVIWKAPDPPPTDVFHAVPAKIIPPPPQPPSSGAAADNPQFEPQPIVVPVVTPPSMITTANSVFKVDAPKVMDQALSHLSAEMAQGSGLSTGGGGNSGTGTAFGSSTGASDQLTGYFYDLKQTSDKKSTGMNSGLWPSIMAKYIAQGWDDSILEPYFKSKAPLYTDFFAISTRASEEAPKAFGLEKEVRPALWVVHYHASVVAPAEGDYRFVGFGDDLLDVKIKGTLVLDAGWISLSNKADLHQPLPNAWSKFYGGAQGPSSIRGMGPADGLLKMGTIFHVDTAETVDMDVLIGDAGGECAFFLLIENVNNTYEKLPEGTPKLPYFQIGDGPAPTFTDKEESPPHTTKAEPWQPGPN